jgi:hypothetical protein
MGIAEKEKASYPNVKPERSPAQTFREWHQVYTRASEKSESIVVIFPKKILDFEQLQN